MKKLLSLLILVSFTIKAQDVTIGTQTWTSKNLNVSTYRNGDKIPQVQDKKAWEKLTTGAWCYYENNPTNGTKYGKLYNWYAVNDPRGLAPIGYHIPTDKEWTTLTDYLGGESEAGTKMKSRSGWKNGKDSSNTSGFAGLPGGERDNCYGNFSYIGSYGYWWSSSEHDTRIDASIAWLRSLSYYASPVSSYTDSKRKGASVRCLRD